jgi:nitrite reductase (NO-forming)
MRRMVLALGLAALIAAPGCKRLAKGPGPAASVPEAGSAALPPLQGEEIATLTAPPDVPPPIERSYATKVIVKLEVQEKVMRLDDGVEYRFWTFGGTVPGRFIRVRQGDLVEFHLENRPENKNAHNIDLHAVLGPGGGATSSLTPPGQESVFSFRAIHAGLFVYHCATTPVGMHIANGMYGLILVEPPGGLPKVDHEYYVMQGEVYTHGRNGAPGLQTFDMEKALREQPEYVVFNGSVASLLGDRALAARVGDHIRIFFGNAGPNLASAFHVIGGIFESVHVEGGTLVNRDVQTTLVPPGGAVTAELWMRVPGRFLLVDHSIFRAFNQGALGAIEVVGPEAKEIYSGRQSQGVYRPEGAAVQAVAEPAPAPPPATPEERIARGEDTFKTICAACHQPDGRGIPGTFPPLAGSDYLNADVARAIGIVLNGHAGPITVNGQKYDNTMPRLGLSNEQVANVLTYVLSQWGNRGGEVTEDQVAKARSAGGP